MKDILKRISELCKTQASFALFFTLVLYFISLAFVLPVVILLTAWIWGGDMQSVQELLSGDLDSFVGGAYLFRVLQTENQLLTWGLIGLLVAYCLGKPQQVLKLEQAPQSGDIVLAILALIFALPLVQATYIPAESFQLPDFLQGFEESMRLREEQSQAVLMRLFSEKSAGILMLNLLVFACVPAICEEVLFRGIIQQQFARNMSPHIAILLSAAIFSFIHFQFYGFFGRMLLGVLLGYFLWYSGSLWPSIFAHFAFNAFSIVMSYMANAYDMLDPEITQDSYQFSPALLLFSLLAVGVLMFLYLRRERTPSIVPHE